MWRRDPPTLPPPQGLCKVSPDSPCSAFAQPHACPGLHTPGQLWGQKERLGSELPPKKSSESQNILAGGGLGAREMPFPTLRHGEFLALWAGIGS